MELHPCVKDGLDELFGEGTAATATTASVIGLFADKIAQKF